jgi:predicted nucleotidyltransferase
MAQVPDNIINLINEFLKKAKENNINISDAILFGSYASGSNNKYSDIDLAVVSEDFEGTRFYDNIKLMKTVLAVSSDIETHPYTPQDFNTSNPFVNEILKTGIRIL